MPIEIVSEHPEPRLTGFCRGAGNALWSLSAIAVRKRRFVLRAMLVAVLLAVVGGAVLLVNSYRSYAKLVDARLARGYLTSRGGIFAAPRTLLPGQKFSRDELAVVLRRTGYLETDSAGEIWNGSFTVLSDAIEIRPANDGGYPEAVRVTFDLNGRIAELSGDGVTLDRFALEPEALTNDARMKEGARRPLAFKEIPTVLVQAITSIEDRRFFDHHGLDVWGVARALLRNAGDERIGQGGSTITQQLVKNTYLTPERTLRRKYAEAMLAFTIERRLPKEDIFALYCNEIYLGQRGALAVRGVDQAARVYFGKHLNELTVGEAATIAGMIQSPARYAPLAHNDAASARRNTVLGTMVRDGFITLEQAAAAAKEPLTISDFDPARESSAPYFIDYVNRRGSSPTVREGLDGAPIITTLDLDLQRMAEEAIKRQLDRLEAIYKPRGLTPQAALVALDPRTGDVLAMVGGKDYAASQLNRATDARRQPGSVFKPFVYATALESGMSPLQTFRDAPQTFTYDHKSKYRPANYGGGYSMRDVWLRTGLIKSLNVVTVDVAMQTGLARVADTTQSFGLPRPAPYPALALGTTEVSPVQIASAYAAFANGGRRIQPNVLARSVSEPGAGRGPRAGSTRGVEDATGSRSQFETEAQGNDQVIQPGTAFMITDMLQGVIEEGTARAARGQIPRTAIAGKTGTSRDGWFVGYSKNLVCAVWIGFDDNKQLGLTGAAAALPAWVDFMKSAVDFRPELGGKSFDRPDGITIVEIDPETGQLATGLCPLHERVVDTDKSGRKVLVNEMRLVGR